MASHQTIDTLVIGGGLVGWSAARELALNQRNVTVADSETVGAATLAGAGIIAPAMSVGAPAPFFRLARPAIEYYPDLVAALDIEGSGPTGYETAGALFVATNADELDRLPLVFEKMLYLKSWGLGNVGDMHMLGPEEARNLFPALGDIHGAIYNSKAARVDGRRLRTALQTSAEAHGATYLAQPVALIEQGPSGYFARIGDTTIAAKHVILSSGAWSSNISETIGISIPVHPQRGQIIHLDIPNTPTGTWPIVLGYHSHYILTFSPNHVVCGATREHDAGFDARTTAGGIHEVLSEGLRVAPGLADGTVSEIRVGLRPFSADGLPLIGEIVDHPGFYVCTGHGPSGLQLGPYSGISVARSIMGHAPDIDMSPFAPGRFAS